MDHMPESRMVISCVLLCFGDLSWGISRVIWAMGGNVKGALGRR